MQRKAREGKGQMGGCAELCLTVPTSIDQASCERQTCRQHFKGHTRIAAHHTQLAKTQQRRRHTRCHRCQTHPDTRVGSPVVLLALPHFVVHVVKNINLVRRGGFPHVPHGFGAVGCALHSAGEVLYTRVDTVCGVFAACVCATESQ